MSWVCTTLQDLCSPIRLQNWSHVTLHAPPPQNLNRQNNLRGPLNPRQTSPLMIVRHQTYVNDNVITFQSMTPDPRRARGCGSARLVVCVLTELYSYISSFLGFRSLGWLSFRSASKGTSKLLARRSAYSGATATLTCQSRRYQPEHVIGSQDPVPIM